MQLDKYDFLILDIIYRYKKAHNNELIRLSGIETNFWSRIQGDEARHTEQSPVGERITRLYLDGYIATRNGYILTRKGKEELNLMAEEIS